MRLCFDVFIFSLARRVRLAARRDRVHHSACPSLLLAVLQGQLIPRGVKGLPMYEDGEEREKEREIKERQRERPHLGGGGERERERREDDDEHGDASPLLSLMFNHEPVDADPSLRRLTFH